jgi:hypothetical protein
MKLPLLSLLAATASALALACGQGHEASTALRESPGAAVVTTTDAPVPVVKPAAAPKRPPCIELDAELGGKRITLEGRVVVDQAFEHPARGKTRPYILRLDAPRCAIGTSEATVAELHLAPSEGVALKPLVGKHVRVSGDPFAAHTAWHARPVVLMTTTTTALP